VRNIKNNDTFVRNYTPFYFCVSPEFLIYTHYPINENWQLLEKPIKFKEFINNLKLSSKFFEDGFYKVEPKKYKSNGIIGQNKLTVYKNNKKDIYLDISIYKLEENSSLISNYLQINDKKYPLYSSKYKLLKKSDNVYEYEYNLNEKGEYYMSFSGNNIPNSYFEYFNIRIICS